MKNKTRTTYLIFDERYDEYYTIESLHKPKVKNVMAKIGDMAEQFDPGYVITDIVEVKEITGFNENNGIMYYQLKNHLGETVTVHSGLVTPIHPWVQWLYKLGFRIRTKLSNTKLWYNNP